MKIAILTSLYQWIELLPSQLYIYYIIWESCKILSTLKKGHLLVLEKEEVAEIVMKFLVSRRCSVYHVEPHQVLSELATNSA